MGTLTIQQVIKITKLGPIDVKCASAENGRFFMERVGNSHSKSYQLDINK